VPAGVVSHKADLMLLDALVCRDTHTHKHRIQSMKRVAASSAAKQLGSVALIRKRDKAVTAQLMSMSSGMHLTSEGNCKLDICMQMKCGVSWGLPD